MILADRGSARKRLDAGPHYALDIRTHVRYSGSVVDCDPDGSLTAGTLDRSAAVAHARALLGRYDPRGGSGIHPSTWELDPHWSDLFPDGGLTRGQVLDCSGPAAITVAMALAAMRTRRGGWLAVMEHPERFRIGLAAMAESGVVLERTVLVTPSRVRPPAPEFAEAIAALVEGFEIVLIPGCWVLPVSAVRRLQARLRTRGGVVICVDGAEPWRVDLRLHTRVLERDDTGGWQDLARSGRLVRRRLRVEVSGRRLGRARGVDMWLPGSESHPTGTRIEVESGSSRIPNPILAPILADATTTSRSRSLMSIVDHVW